MNFQFFVSSSRHEMTSTKFDETIVCQRIIIRLYILRVRIQSPKTEPNPISGTYPALTHSINHKILIPHSIQYFGVFSMESGFNILIGWFSNKCERYTHNPITSQIGHSQHSCVCVWNADFLIFIHQSQCPILCNVRLLFALSSPQLDPDYLNMNFAYFMNGYDSNENVKRKMGTKKKVFEREKTTNYLFKMY